MLLKKISTWHKIIAEKTSTAGGYDVFNAVKSVFGDTWEKEKINKAGPLTLAQIQKIKEEINA